MGSSWMNALIFLQNVTGLLNSSFILARILTTLRLGDILQVEHLRFWSGIPVSISHSDPPSTFKVLHHWCLRLGGSPYPLALDHSRLGGITLVVIWLHNSSSSTLYLLLHSAPHYTGNSRWRKQLEKHQCLPHLHPRTHGHIHLPSGTQWMPAT